MHDGGFLGGSSIRISDFDNPSGLLARAAARGAAHCRVCCRGRRLRWRQDQPSGCALRSLCHPSRQSHARRCLASPVRPHAGPSACRRGRRSSSGHLAGGQARRARTAGSGTSGAASRPVARRRSLHHAVAGPLRRTLCDTWADHCGEASGRGTWAQEAISEGLVIARQPVQIGIRSAARPQAREYVRRGGGLIYSGPNLLEELYDLPRLRMDVGEVAPPYDHAEFTRTAAATPAWTYLCGRIAARNASVSRAASRVRPCQWPADTLGGRGSPRASASGAGARGPGRRAFARPPAGSSSGCPRP